MEKETMKNEEDEEALSVGMDGKESKDKREEEHADADAGAVRHQAKKRRKEKEWVERLEERFVDVNGYAIAKQHVRKLRAENRIEETEGLTYGEIDFKGFEELLRKALTFCGKEGAEDLKFVDIGSGTGKSVAVVAEVFPDRFASAVGIEIVQDLHNCGEKALAGMDKCVLLCGDSFKLEDQWTDADIVFAPTTCFTDDMLEKLIQGVEKMKPGALLINSTRELDSKHILLLHKGSYKYYRGRLEFMIYKKI